MQIINIPLHLPFLDTIADQLLNDNKNNLEDLANFIIIVPNFKSTIALQEAFLRVSLGQPLILPKIISLHNLEFLISPTSLQQPHLKNLVTNSDFFKPTISKFARNCILSKFIKEKEKNISTIQALDLARSLGNTLDAAYMQDINFSSMENIVTINLAKHWQDNLKFLSILTDMWPRFLQDNNYLDVEQRKKVVLNLQSLIWQKLPNNNKLVFVNIVSFFKPVLYLLKSGLQTKNARAYFYGIDHTLNPEDINYTHPQKIISTTLEYLGIKKEDIISLHKMSVQEKFIHNLFNLEINKSLDKQEVQNNINNIALLKTATEDEEAKVIALAVREKLEQPSQRITVICNNKNLVQRIIKELQRWDIEANDHLGDLLQETLHYKIFLATLIFISEDFNIHNLYTILKHPMVNFGLPQKKYKFIVDALDTHIFRELKLNVIKENYYKEAIDYINNNSYISTTLKPLLIDFLQKVEVAFKNISLFLKSGAPISPLELIKRHIKLVEHITVKKKGQSIVWQNQEGKTLSAKLLNLMEECKNLPNIITTGTVSLFNYIHNITLDEYTTLFNLYFAQETIIQRYNKDHRINIYSGLTSTITNTSTVIIAACNENMLPYLPVVNPWFNKYIEEGLGFLPSESKISEQAHIFMQLLGNKEIILTRSTKEGKNATKPSRWFYKIETLLKLYKINLTNYVQKYSYLQDLAWQLDKTEDNITLKKPTAIVDKKLFPSSIAATDIDLLYQNPYIFFIKKILNYKILKPIGINKNSIQTLYGTYMHDTIESIVNIIHNNKSQYKISTNRILTTQIEEKINEYFYPLLKDDYKFKTFQYTAIKKSLHAFLESDIKHILNTDKILTEKTGEYNLQLADNWQIKITAKVDRIDLNLSHNYILISDYKTKSSLDNNTKPKSYMKQLQTASLILYHNQAFNLLSNVQNIDARFIYLGKNSSKTIMKKEEEDNIVNKNKHNLQDTIATIEKDLAKTITTKLTSEENLLFAFDDNYIKDTSAPYLHFARFKEWNTNINLLEDAVKSPDIVLVGEEDEQ